LFDIIAVDTDAWFYRAHTPHDVLSSAEGEKKCKYLQACQDWRAIFTPLCMSVDGMLGFEAEFFVKKMSDFLASKWERHYGVVIGWIRTCLSFAFLRAVLLCVHGSCAKRRSLGIVDGSSLPIVSSFACFCVCLFLFLFCGVTQSFSHNNNNNNYITKYKE